MNIEVIKFGGTSLKDYDSRQRAIHIIQKYAMTHHVVVVVSAMGRYDDAYATDTLASLIHNYVSQKEKDRLLSIGEIISSIVLCDELLQADISATSLSIQKTGIRTDNNYGKARLSFVNTDTLYQALKTYRVVVVPGFQGWSEEKEVTTLGRGGSDYSAVILASALALDHVTIYSDVPGIYSADPKTISEAFLVSRISYEQAIEIAQYKASVINENAVCYAKKHHIRVHLKSTFGSDQSTIIEADAPAHTFLCYAKGYVKVTGDKLVPNVKSFQISAQEWMIEKAYLAQYQTTSLVDATYVMLHFVGFNKDLLPIIQNISQETFWSAKDDHNTFFVAEKTFEQTINHWHHQLIGGGKNDI